MPTSEEGFNNQVDMMTCFVDNSQLLSLTNSSIAQWAHEQSSHGGMEGGYTWAQQHGASLTKADLATAVAQLPTCQEQRTVLSSQCGIIHWGDKPATSWQVDYMESWIGQCFVLTVIDTYSG